MPIIRDVPLSLRPEEILRREGINKHSNLRRDLKDLIHELLVVVRSKHLLEPAIAYSICHVKDLRHNQLHLNGGVILRGIAIGSIMADAMELAIVVCSIGPKLETETSIYLDADEPLRGLLLDGIGSAAVDCLTQKACRLIALEAQGRGYKTSSPLSPGMQGLPITNQKQLFQLVPAEEIGVGLSSAGVMIPLKSVSMIVGIGPMMKTWSQAEFCARCRLSKTCAHRVNRFK